jgi:aspartyl-tRNA(Asn)/glutamyl-tRNA(Gln) amidotransferase subunit C
LARLALSDEETERFRGDLEAILDYVAQIQSTDTRGVSEDLNPDRTDNVFREDRVHPSLTRDEALSNAPDTDGQYFRVPLMLPGEGH